MAKTDISVKELVNKVKRKELSLPEMQRKYVWPATRVRDLLDSLYRGYPSGNILVWETDEDVVTRDMSVLPDQTPTTSSRLLLLDGQQRITSLASILTGEPVQVRNRKRPIDILFNLDHPEGPPIEVLEVDEEDITPDIDEMEDTETATMDIQEELRKRTFVVAARALKNDPKWVPVSDIFKKDHSDILQKAGITSFTDPNYRKYSQRLQNVKKIEDYMYSMHLLEKTMSYEEVTEIFVRVNSLGVKLRGSDLALAQITSKWKGFIKLMEEYSGQFDDDGEYILDWILVRLMTIFATKQSRFKTIGRYSKTKLEEAWETTKKSLSFAMNFIRHNAGIDNLEYLSAAFLIIPIAVYAQLHNEELSQEEEKKLLRWFFIAHMRGHYSMGSSESILDSDLNILFRNSGLDVLINNLMQHVKKAEIDPEELSGKGLRSPLFTMLYFVLKSNGAKDWLTGLQLSDKTLGDTHKIQYHHIFPKSLLHEAGFEQKEINEIANFAFIGGKTNRHILNKEPKVYFEKEIIPKRGEEALTSQLIPMDKTLWEMSAYKSFLYYRRGEVAKTINKFLSRYI